MALTKASSKTLKNVSPSVCDVPPSEVKAINFVYPCPYTMCGCCFENKKSPFCKCCGPCVPPYCCLKPKPQELCRNLCCEVPCCNPCCEAPCCNPCCEATCCDPCCDAPCCNPGCKAPTGSASPAAGNDQPKKIAPKSPKPTKTQSPSNSQYKSTPHSSESTTPIQSPSKKTQSIASSKKTKSIASSKKTFEDWQEAPMQGNDYLVKPCSSKCPCPVCCPCPPPPCYPMKISIQPNFPLETTQAGNDEQVKEDCDKKPAMSFVVCGPCCPQ